MHLYSAHQVIFLSEALHPSSPSPSTGSVGTASFWGMRSALHLPDVPAILVGENWRGAGALLA